MVLLEPQSWDSKHFAIPIAKLTLDEADTPEDVLRVLFKSRFAFVSARTGSHEVRKSRVLEKSGFTIADIRLHLDLDLRKFRRRKLLSSMKLAGYRAKYHRRLREISRESFWSDHFHLDPRFDPRKVDQMYGIWLDKCVREDYVILVATSHDQATGFLAAREQGGHFYIELVAVANEVRGKSVGHDLTVRALQNAKRTFQKAAVGVQLTNVPAVRLYEKVGFQLESSELTFHWWRE